MRANHVKFLIAVNSTNLELLWNNFARTDQDLRNPQLKSFCDITETEKLYFGVGTIHKQRF